MEFNKKCGKGKEFPPSHSKYFWPLHVIDCNSCERLISGNLCYDLTDHLPNFLIVSRLSSLPASTKVFRRNYSNLDRETLISDIQSIDWNSLFKKSSDPSNMFDNFILSYQRLLIYMYLSSNYLNKISKLDQSHGLLLELEPPLE